MSDSKLNAELAMLEAEIDENAKANLSVPLSGQDKNKNNDLESRNFQNLELNEIEADKIAPAQPQNEMWAGLWGLTGLVLSGRYGQHWIISDAECQELGKVTDKFMDKYFPETDVGIEFAMISTAAAVFAPKFIMHQQLIVQEMQTEDAQTDDAEVMLKGVDDEQ